MLMERQPERALIDAVPILAGNDGPRIQADYDQLHALSCIRCGRVDCELLPAGHVRTEVRPGEHLVWPVVTCPEHQGGTP